MPLSKEFPKPIFVTNNPHDNNTDKAVDPQLEKVFTGGKYYLSTAQDPSIRTSVFQYKKNFAQAMLSHADPTLLAI